MAKDLFETSIDWNDLLDTGPAETIEEMVRARRPREREWVSCHHPVPNGPGQVRRAAAPAMIARVAAVTEQGCNVRVWCTERLAFIEEFFAPWSCIVSRVSATRYGLTGCKDNSLVEAA